MADKFTRLPVSMYPEDNERIIKLQAVIQARLGKRVSAAHIVRMALRELEKVEITNKLSWS